MRVIWIVLWHEIKITLLKPSFWLTTLGLPIFMIVFYAIIGISAGSEVSQYLSKVTTVQHAGEKPAGLVDQSGIITHLPASISAGAVRRFTDLETAQQALQAGEIEPLAIIPHDYRQNRQIILMMQDYSTMGALQGDLYYYLVTYNLVGDEALARLLINPTQGMGTHYLVQTPHTSGDLVRAIMPMITLFIFISLISMSSGWMLHSVSREKTNRTAEVLLLSLDPRQLMVGKIIGLSVVAFVQMLVWMVGGLALSQGAATLLSGKVLDLPASYLGWSAVFFAFGYLLYASLLGAVGAMAPNHHDDGQLALLISLPQLLPLLFFTAFANAPSGPAATFLSLFPLTAAIAMPTRLAGSSVPVWQLLTSLGLLMLATAWAVNISARAFRPETLLSSKAVGWERVKERWKERRENKRTQADNSIP